MPEEIKNPVERLISIFKCRNQKKLAKLLNISETTISRWNQGRMAPSTKNVIEGLMARQKRLENIIKSFQPF